MPICPECNRIIDYLERWGKVWMKFHYSLEDGMDCFRETGAHFEKVSDWNPNKMEFRCPECKTILFCSLEGARLFLAKIERG